MKMMLSHPSIWSWRLFFSWPPSADGWPWKMNFDHPFWNRTSFNMSNVPHIAWCPEGVQLWQFQYHYYPPTPCSTWSYQQRPGHWYLTQIDQNSSKGWLLPPPYLSPIRKDHHNPRHLVWKQFINNLATQKKELLLNYDKYTNRQTQRWKDKMPTGQNANRT